MVARMSALLGMSGIDRAVRMVGANTLMLYVERGYRRSMSFCSCLALAALPSLAYVSALSSRENSLLPNLADDCRLLSALLARPISTSNKAFCANENFGVAG